MSNNFSKKRFLALVCAICLIACSCFTGITVSADDPVVLSPTDPTYITLTDIGLSGGSYTNGKGTYAPGLDNTVFSVYNTATGNGWPRIHFGALSGTDRSGFGIFFTGSGTIKIGDDGSGADYKLGYTAAVVNPADFGLESFLGERVLLQFETHILDLDGGGVNNDIRLSLSVNGQYATTVEAYNKLDRFGNRIIFMDGTHLISGYRVEAAAEKNTYESWTFSDLGISDGGPQVSMTGEMPGPLDGSMFVGRINFDKASIGQFYIGTGGWYGLVIQAPSASDLDNLNMQIVSTSGGNVSFGTIYSSVAGVELRGNDQLVLGISFEYFDTDLTSSPQRTNLKIGVWINGELYDGKYFVTSGLPTVASFARRIHTQLMNNVYVYSVTERNDLAMPEFESYTVADTEPTFATANTNTGNYSGTIPFDSIDGKVFAAKIKYSSTAQQFHYAADSSSNYGGFTFYPTSDGANLRILKQGGSITNHPNTTLTATEIFGEGGSFYNEFLLQITTEFVDADYDGNEDDVKLGLWFNGKLARGLYFYLIDAVSQLGTRILANESGVPKIYSYYEELPEEIDDYSEWTYSDVDKADGTNASGWYQSNITGDTLDQTLFCGNATFTASDQYVLLGSLRGYYGCGFRSVDSTTLTFGIYLSAGSGYARCLDFNAADFGYESFFNQKIELSIASRIRKNNGDGTYLVEFFPMIDGKLSKNKSWTLNVNAGKFKRSMAIINAVVVESVSTTPAAETIPSDFKQLTLNDMGISKNKTNWQGTGYYPGSWDETVLSLNVNFGTALGRVRYAKASGSYSGIALYRVGANLYFGADDSPFADKNSPKFSSIIITPASLGLESFDNQNLRLDFVTEYVDIDLDGSEDDIKTGLFINGTLAGGHYLYAIDGVAAADHGFSVNNSNVASVSGVEVDERTIDESDYDFYTLKDVGIIDGIGTAYGEFFDEYRVKIQGDSYDGILFGAKVKFTQTSARMHYAASDASQFSGVQLRLLESGSLVVEPYSTRLSYDTVIIDPAQFDLATFANTAFIVKFSTDVVNADGNGTDDIRLGVWINGKLANNSYIYILDQVDDLDCNINFNETTTTEHYSLWDIDDPINAEARYYQIDATHPYLVTADYIISTAGDRFNNGAQVTTSGDYTAYFAATGDLKAAEQTVILWTEWDVHPDGVMNILDLIALMKARAEISPATLSGQFAARKLNTADSLVKLRKNLFGIAELDTDFSYSLTKTDVDGAVMPIGAWVSPATYPAKVSSGIDLASYGIEMNFLQDKYFDMIEDLGINQLSFSDRTYNDSPMTIQMSLALAEKYGMDVYVRDSAIADNATSATDLAARVNAYSRYSSFAGINVADEPHTSSFNGDATTVSAYSVANKSTLLNSFVNLLGFTNLFGDYTLGNSDYKAYLAEVIDVLNPKVLSFDHYSINRGNAARSHFGTLEAIREASLSANIPFIGFITTGEDYTQGVITTDNETPTAAQLRWQVNTLLAYGAKGYNWFTLIQPWYFALQGDNGTVTGLDFDRCGLIGANGQETRNYDTAKAINTFVGNIDHILMDSTSVDVLAAGSTAQSETGISKTTLNGTTVSEGNSTGTVVGVFDYNGKTAYYVVNNDQSNAQNVTLTFSTSKSFKVYTESGETTATASSRVLALGAGAAALVVVD